jgi:hypothetical protein
MTKETLDEAISSGAKTQLKANDVISSGTKIRLSIDQMVSLVEALSILEVAEGREDTKWMGDISRTIKGVKNILNAAGWGIE